MVIDRRLPPALLMCVLVGAALGWLLIPEPAPEAPAPGAHVTHAESAPPPESARPVPAVLPAPAPRERAPLGDGLIRGVVRFGDGSPCAGLQLVAEPPRNDGLFWWEQSRATPDELRADHAATAQWLKDNALRATTGLDGEFQFAGVGQGEYLLFSNDSGRLLEQRPQRGKAGDVLELVARRVIHVPLEVTFPGGEVPARLAIAVTPHVGAVRNVSWARGGSIELAPGKQTIATQTAYGMARAELEVEVPEQGMEGPIRLELKHVDGLVVHVDFPRPFYVGARLVVMRTDLVPPTLTDLSKKLPYNPVFTSPWAAPKLEPGRYTAMVLLSEVEVLAREEIDYTGGYREVTLRVPPLSRADHIVLRVFDTRGQALDEVEVFFFPEGSTRRQVASVSRRGKGEYWLRPGPVHEYFFGNPYSPPTFWVVRATHSSFGTQMITTPIDSRDDLELRFGPKGTFTVVLDGLVEGNHDYRLSIRPRGGTEEDYTGRGHLLESAPTTPARARTSMEIPPGVVVVTVRCLGPLESQFAGVTIAEREFHFTGEPMEARFTLPPLHDLTIDLSEAGTIAQLRIKGEAVRGLQDAKPVDGKVRFRNLPAGVYRLVADGGEMHVRVPSGTVLFQPAPFNAALVSRVDSANRMGGFGLLPGDIIIEVNGATPEGTFWAVHRMIAAAGAQGDVSLRVRRDGRTFTVNAPGEDWEKMGGFFFEAIRVD